MPKTLKIRYSGVGVYANGYLLSRVQNVSSDTDLGEEEARELTNSEVVEYTSTNPQVSVSIETNEYGSIRNLLAVAGITGIGNVLNDNKLWLRETTFDNAATDIGIQVQEDGALTRTCLINESYLSSLSWNFDVGGVATESFNFEADNKLWLLNASRQAYSLMAISGVVTSYSVTGGFPIQSPSSDYVAVKLYVDGVEATGASIIGDGVAIGSVQIGLITGVNVGTSISTGGPWGYSVAPAVSSGMRPPGMPKIRAFISKKSPGGTISQQTSRIAAGGTIGSIPRGKMDILFVTGLTANLLTSGAETNFLRLQSVSIDVDYSRDILSELGHYRAYDRALTYPIPITVSFSALASDLEEWAKFSLATVTTVSSLGISNFSKSGQLKITIFGTQDTDTSVTRAPKKAIIISGLQITSESFGVDVGGNATQDYTAKASAFYVTGFGTPGVYPLVAAPTD